MSRRKEIYNANKSAKVGDSITCPVCGTVFVKRQWQQAFCCGKCKDAYWNAKGDRHSDPNYHRHYNMKHPERYDYMIMTARNEDERREFEAIKELAVNPDFREYVEESALSYDGSWDAHACNVSLAQQLDNYEGVGADY